MSITLPATLKDIALQNAEHVLQVLETDAEKGLSAEEADKRVKQFGANVISAKKRRPGGRNYSSILKVPL